jgi:hypothetical protein
LNKVTPQPDAYVLIIREHWDALTGMYAAFEGRAPIMEFHVASGQIRVYSAVEYLEDLSVRTRELAKRQYEKAVAEGALMVFVRDDSKEILRSYVFPAVKRFSMQAGRKARALRSSSRRR